jgi:pimeloyl-ACP methyl ester carboxylesterase
VVVVLGHSLGGVLGLALASGWFGVRVAAVCGLGIKLHWSAEELARAAEFAGRPGRAFGTRAEALQRALKVAGLWGLVPADSPLADAAVVESADGWRLALDNAAFGVGAPDMPGLLAACRAEVVLAAGEDDPMCPPEQLRALQPAAVVLPGLGHNAHVQNPDALLPLLHRLRAAAT